MQRAFDTRTEAYPLLPVIGNRLMHVWMWGCHIALVLSRLTESHHLNLSHLWQRCEESLSGHTEALFAAKVEGSSEDRDGFLVKISHPQVRWHRANRKCTPGQWQRGLGEAGKERARAIGI